MVSLKYHNVIQHKSGLGNGWARYSCSKCQDYVHMEKWRLCGESESPQLPVEFLFLFPLAFHSSRRRSGESLMSCSIGMINSSMMFVGGGCNEQDVCTLLSLLPLLFPLVRLLIQDDYIEQFRRQIEGPNPPSFAHCLEYSVDFV